MIDFLSDELFSSNKYFVNQKNLSLTMQHKLAKMEPRQNCAFVFSEFIFLFVRKVLICRLFYFHLNSMALRIEEVCAIVCFLVFSFWKSLCIPRRSLKRNSLCCLSFMGSNLNRNVSFSFPKKERKYHNIINFLKWTMWRSSQVIWIFTHFPFSGLNPP